MQVSCFSSYLVKFQICSSASRERDGLHSDDATKQPDKISNLTKSLQRTPLSPWISLESMAEIGNHIFSESGTSFWSSSLWRKKKNIYKVLGRWISFAIQTGVTNKGNDQQKDDTIKAVHWPLQKDGDGAINDDVPQTSANSNDPWCAAI